MSTEDSQSHVPEDRPVRDAEARPISGPWIVVGVICLLIGVAMGFVMSSLGK